MQQILARPFLLLLLSSMAIPRHTPATVIRGALPPIVFAVNQSLEQSTSYKVDSTEKYAGGFRQIRLVSVRSGKLQRFHVGYREEDAGRPPIMRELVIVGTKVCSRQTLTAKYRCNNSAEEAANYTGPTRMFTNGTGGDELLDTATFTSIGSVEAGQRICDGYAFRSVPHFPQTNRATGLLFVDHVTKRPCEEEEALVYPADPTVRTTLDYVWSHFDDPSLTIPSIAGL